MTKDSEDLISSKKKMGRTERLYAGDDVYCLTCKKGIMKPSNPNYPLRQNHCFICDNCGERLNITPALTVE